MTFICMQLLTCLHVFDEVKRKRNKKCHQVRKEHDYPVLIMFPRKWHNAIKPAMKDVLNNKEPLIEERKGILTQKDVRDGLVFVFFIVTHKNFKKY